MRDIPIAELDARIADRDVPFTIWDGKVRMSVAGVQDKLLVYLDAPLDRGGRLFLVDGPRLASTHILKPDLGQPRLPHIAVNEHFCMTLARRIGGRLCRALWGRPQTDAARSAAVGKRGQQGGCRSGTVERVSGK
jgi:hypothetical protein